MALPLTDKTDLTNKSPRVLFWQVDQSHVMPLYQIYINGDTPHRQNQQNQQKPVSLFTI